MNKDDIVQNEFAEESKKITGWQIIWLILDIILILMVLFLAIIPSFIVQGIFRGVSYNLFYYVGVVLFWVGCPVFSIIFFIRVKDKRIKWIVITTLLLSLLLNILVIIVYNYSFPKFAASIIISFTGSAVFLALGVFVWILFCRKGLSNRFLLIKLVLFFLLLLIMVAPVFLNIYLPYIYSPPALTPKSIEIYNRWIQLIKNHNQYSFRVGLHGGITLQNENEVLYSNEAWKCFSEGERVDIDNLCHGHYRLESLERVFRVSNIVLFYKDGNYIFPKGPGVAYSLNGENPNNIESKIISEAKPFIKITGNWYLSRNLILRESRTDELFSIPKALIDRSMDISRISEEELHRFDNWQNPKDPNNTDKLVIQGRPNETN